MTLILGPAAAAGVVFGALYLFLTWLFAYLKISGWLVPGIVLALALFFALLVYTTSPNWHIGG